MRKLILFILLFILAYAGWFLYTEIYTETAQPVDSISFEIEKGEDVTAMTQRLAEEHVVRNAFLFKRYLIHKGVDTKIRAGKFTVDAPITIARVVEALKYPSQDEMSLTIIPGWNLSDIAEYFVREGIITDEQELYDMVGKPAVRNNTMDDDLIKNLPVMKDKLAGVSYEGYFAPETFRFYKDATLADIVQKFVTYQNDRFTEQMYLDIAQQDRTVYEVMILASILEREVRSDDDRKLVADLFWRRYDLNWALQADSTVHYAVGKANNVYTTQEDRDSISPWNTYRYPGLPLGPISNPSISSIMAAIYPTKNDYWYFLTDDKGQVHYAKDLDQHNVNKWKWFE